MLEMRALLDAGYTITLHTDSRGGYSASIISSPGEGRRYAAAGETPGEAMWIAMDRAGWNMGPYPGDSDAEQMAAQVRALMFTVESLRSVYDQAFQRGAESVTGKRAPRRPKRSGAKLELV